MVTDELRCLDAHEGNCKGPVEYRMALSPSGKQFPRCERHWEERLEEQERINQRYPVMRPADFDPLMAGERWDEDDPWP